MMETELLRLMNFGKELGLDLSGVEKEVREQLRIMEVRDDLGLAPQN